MSRWSLWAVALLVLAFVATRGTGQVKDKDKDPKTDPKPPVPTVPDKKDAEKKLLKTQNVAGEITYIEQNKQGFTLKVTYQYSELNQGEYNAMASEQQNALRAAARRDYNAQAGHLRSAAEHQSRLYSVKNTHKDFKIEAAENCKVRLPAPKAAFDDMGNVKKYTAKELAALRGPDKMFDGEWSDLTNGQIVQVTIVLPKPMAKPVKKDDLELKEDNKIEATKVAVLKQPVSK